MLGPVEQVCTVSWLPRCGRRQPSRPMPLRMRRCDAAMRAPDSDAAALRLGVAARALVPVLLATLLDGNVIWLHGRGRIVRLGSTATHRA